jgi:WD40 repeat protein
MRPVTLLALALPAVAQEYTRDIRPILEKYCFACHYTGVKMGSFELGTYDELMKGGPKGRAVVPGSSAESHLFQMVSGSMQPYMPMDGKKLAAGELDILRRWIDAGAKGPSLPEPVTKPSTGARIKPSVPVKPRIFAMALSPDGTTLALGEYQKVVLKNASTRETVAELKDQVENVRAVAFSRDGKLLAAAGGVPGLRGEVKLWDLDRKAVRLAFKGHLDCIFAVAISPDARLIATSSYDKLIKLWDAGTGQEVRTLNDHIDAVYALAFTPDGKRLVSGAADRTVKIWDVATGERLYTLGEPADGINTIALSPDGTAVAAAGIDKSIRVWSLGPKSGTLLATLIAHEDSILKLAWSADGKWIASSAADRSVKVFNARDLAEIKAFPGQPDWAYGLEFSSDGAALLTGRLDGTLETIPLRDRRQL